MEGKWGLGGLASFEKRVGREYTCGLHRRREMKNSLHIYTLANQYNILVSIGTICCVLQFRLHTVGGLSKLYTIYGTEV